MRLRNYIRVLEQIQVLSMCAWVFLLIVHVGDIIFYNNSQNLNIVLIVVFRYVAILIAVGAAICMRYLKPVLRRIAFNRAIAANLRLFDALEGLTNATTTTKERFELLKDAWGNKTMDKEK